MILPGRECLVVGGGVAGLAVARALALRGARVTVLERAAGIAEVGAGIQVSPNGGRVLDALGLGPAFGAVSMASEAVVLRDQRGAEVLRMDLAGRGRFALVHRADLIGVLEAGAREAGVSIETNARVRAVRLGPDGASVEMQDGGTRAASLVIGADGLHSPTRAALTGEDAPTFTGQVAWRALVDAPQGVPSQAQVFMAPGRHVVAYPVRGGAMLNLVAVEERAEWAAEGWHHSGDPDLMRATFSDLTGPVTAWLSRVERCMVWGLFRHPVSPRWYAPGVAVLGDAAHPTLPFLAQGACMALEDAWVLAQCLASHDTDAAALASYQAQRVPRVTRIVAAATANARNYHLAGPRRRVAHLALRAVNTVAPQAMLGRFDWLYGHDVTS